MQGDYVGLSGLQDFFARLAKMTDGTFKVNPVSFTPIGDELVVLHSKNTMTSFGRQVEIDVVVVWRIVEGRIAEVWDIVPSVHTASGDRVQVKDSDKEL